MPTDNHDRLLIDVLNAAGHAGAAELAEKVLAARSPASGKATSEPAAAQPAAAPSLLAAPSTEAEQRAEGSFVLAAMKRDLNLDDDFTPRRPSVPPADEAA
jgi:hypothetical protein